MKKNFLTLIKIIIISLIAIYFIPTMPSYASNAKNQAPNMAVSWPDNPNKNGYDLMMLDWYCEVDAKNTYWGVHSWGNGYAGFQNKDGKHILILSIWDGKNGEKPKVEYVSNGDGSDFGGEGTGKHVFTNYNWKAGKWYTMCVGTRTINGKTEYGQWIREGDGKWLLTAIISYPEPNLKFKNSILFQEDWTFNNLLRKCRVRNAYGRKYGTKTWESWSSGKIYNYRYLEFSGNSSVGEKTEFNIKSDCDWGISRKDGGYIMIQAGGKTSLVHKKIPLNFKLSNQSSKPVAANPVWKKVKAK